MDIHEIDVYDVEVANKYVNEFFSKIWSVRVPAISIIPVEAIRSRGMYTTGDRNIDRQLANSETFIGVNIPKMVDHYMNGVTITFLKEKDCQEIYKRCFIHLKTWYIFNKKYPTNKRCPHEDLANIKKFATSVFAHVGNLDFEEYSDKIDLDGLYTTRISMDQLFKKDESINTEKRQAQDDYVPPPAPHEQYDIDRFNKELRKMEEPPIRGQSKWK